MSYSYRSYSESSLSCPHFKLNFSPAISPEISFVTIFQGLPIELKVKIVGIYARSINGRELISLKFFNRFSNSDGKRVPSIQKLPLETSLVSCSSHSSNSPLSLGANSSSKSKRHSLPKTLMNGLKGFSHKRSSSRDRTKPIIVKHSISSDNSSNESINDRVQESPYLEEFVNLLKESVTAVDLIWCISTHSTSSSPSTIKNNRIPENIYTLFERFPNLHTLKITPGSDSISTKQLLSEVPDDLISYLVENTKYIIVLSKESSPTRLLAESNFLKKIIKICYVTDQNIIGVSILTNLKSLQIITKGNNQRSSLSSLITFLHNYQLVHGDQQNFLLTSVKYDFLRLTSIESLQALLSLLSSNKNVLKLFNLEFGSVETNVPIHVYPILGEFKIKNFILNLNPRSEETKLDLEMLHKVDKLERLSLRFLTNENSELLNRKPFKRFQFIRCLCIQFNVRSTINFDHIFPNLRELQIIDSTIWIKFDELPKYLSKLVLRRTTILQTDASQIQAVDISRYDHLTDMEFNAIDSVNLIGLPISLTKLDFTDIKQGSYSLDLFQNLDNLIELRINCNTLKDKFADVLANSLLPKNLKTLSFSLNKEFTYVGSFPKSLRTCLINLPSSRKLRSSYGIYVNTQHSPDEISNAGLLELNEFDNSKENVSLYIPYLGNTYLDISGSQLVKLTVIVPEINAEIKQRLLFLDDTTQIKEVGYP